MDALPPVLSPALRRLRTPPYLVFILKGVLFPPFSMKLGSLISLLQITGW